jgi:hypothetical protein
MLGLVLLYVGAVLIVNGLTGLGRIAPREAAVMNLFAGALAVLASMHQIAGGTAPGIRAGAFGLLFGFTYLWVAYAEWTGQDGRGLGWFSGFVALTAVWVAADELQAATSLQGAWLAACWAAWAVLWTGFFVVGVWPRTSWRRPLAALSIAQGVLTAWLPGYLLLSGRIVAP